MCPCLGPILDHAGLFPSHTCASWPPAPRPPPAGLWSLDDPAAPETAAVIADAMQRPEAYVLKPQREGGGNNLYGDELVARLRQVGASGCGA